LLATTRFVIEPSRSIESVTTSPGATRKAVDPCASARFNNATGARSVPDPIDVARAQPRSCDA